MELEDPGFDFSVLSEFRDSLTGEDRAGRLPELMPQRADQAGLLIGRGKVRTDSTHILARTRTLNRLELIGESVRAALEQLAQIAPGRLSPRIQPGWDIRYGHRADQTDPAWRRRYTLRAGVESAISEAVRAHGLPRCRYIGLAKTRLQHVLIACAMNAARIADWTATTPGSRTPTQQLRNPLQDPHSKLANRVLAGALEPARPLVGHVTILPRQGGLSGHGPGPDTHP